MSSGIVFRYGGPLGWLCDHQEQTSLSSCEAEIRVTNATLKKVVDFCHLCTSMCEAGYSLPDATHPTFLYNDNVENKSNTVKQVSGKINPSDIFTKEMHDGTHFRRLRDLYMSHYLIFFKTLYWQFIMPANCFHPLLFLLLLGLRYPPASLPTLQLLLLPLSVKI